MNGQLIESLSASIDGLLPSCQMAARPVQPRPATLGPLRSGLLLLHSLIILAVQLGDSGTREMLEAILQDEERHVDWTEAQLDQIKQMGNQTYLSEQRD